MENMFTEAELREILLSAEAGFRVREAVAEAMGADAGPMRDARAALFRSAKEAGIDDWIIEKKKRFEPTEAFDDLVESILREYDEDTFWVELEGRLGERDFDIYASDEEFAEAEKTGKYPERVVWYYRKYRKEFSEHGIDRLEINEDI
jgi:hypothetical protein